MFDGLGRSRLDNLNGEKNGEQKEKEASPAVEFSDDRPVLLAVELVFMGI